jgi:hypothetical protein
MKALICEPCLSEFGWEVMEWQGYVREQAKGCDAVVVCSRNGRQGLYDGIPNLLFIPHSIKASVTDHRCREVDEIDLGQAKYEIQRVQDYLLSLGYEIKLLQIPHPDKRFKDRFRADPFAPQAFAVYGQYAIVHARAKIDTTGGEPNYPAGLWNDLAAKMLARFGRVLAIGTPTESLCPDGCIDMRGLDLTMICDLMAGAKVTVGPSSGPMHLASLSKCPHVAWTNSRKTWSRYARGWNPHGTPNVCLRMESDPLPPDRIMAAINGLIDGRDSGIVYVCCGPDWPKVLQCSLVTLRNYYDGPVTVFTDDATKEMEDVCFWQDCELVELKIDAPNPHYASRHIKTRIIELCPYRKGLFIDADTVILADPTPAFDALKGCDIAMTTETPCPTVGSREYRNNPPDGLATLALCGSDYPHYHSSTIAFRRTQSTLHLSKLWHNEWLAMAETYRNRRIQDQPSLARALCRWGGRVGDLDKRYNSRSKVVDGTERGDLLTDDTVIYSACARNGQYHRLCADAVGVKFEKRVRRRGDRY